MELIKMQLNRVIRGWQESIQLVGDGSEIEPGSTLIFNVSLAKIGKKAE